MKPKLIKCEFCDCVIEEKDKLTISVEGIKKPVAVFKACYNCRNAIKLFIGKHWLKIIKVSNKTFAKEK